MSCRSISKLDENMCNENDENSLQELVKQHIRSVPDFPKPGILFWDWLPVLKNPKAHNALSVLMRRHMENVTPKPDVIVALDARGFLFGPIIALQLEIPFVPIRKKGKLPGEVFQEAYTLEYGTNILEMQTDAIASGQKVVVLDDLLATGGSLKAACNLLKQAGASVVKCIVLIELPDLKGRDVVEVPVYSFIQL